MTVFDKNMAEKLRDRLIKVLDTLEFTYVVADDCDDFVKSLDTMNKQIQQVRKYYKEEELDGDTYWTDSEDST